MNNQGKQCERSTVQSIGFRETVAQSLGAVVAALNMKNAHEAAEGVGIKELLADWFELGYVETDSQFNLARENHSGYEMIDLVHPQLNTRLLFVDGFDREAESTITEHFGENSILARLADYEGIAIYDVPVGARSLARTLLVRPFEENYMDQICSVKSVLLEALSDADTNSFGVSVNNVAINYNGGNSDQIELLIVPPVSLEK